jgi:hypothetical protein
VRRWKARKILEQVGLHLKRYQQLFYALVLESQEDKKKKAKAQKKK